MKEVVKMKRLTIEIPEELFYTLKRICIEEKTTVKDFLTKLIKTKLSE